MTSRLKCRTYANNIINSSRSNSSSNAPTQASMRVHHISTSNSPACSGTSSFFNRLVWDPRNGGIQQTF
jgi:hypothetical protein